MMLYLVPKYKLWFPLSISTKISTINIRKYSFSFHILRFLLLKSPSFTQREVSHENAFKKAKSRRLFLVVQSIFIIQTQQYIKQAKKIVHKSPGHVPWSSVKVTMIRCRARQKTNTKYQKYKSIHIYICMYMQKRTMTNNYSWRGGLSVAPQDASWRAFQMV